MLRFRDFLFISLFSSVLFNFSLLPTQRNFSLIATERNYRLKLIEKLSYLSKKFGGKLSFTIWNLTIRTRTKKLNEWNNTTDVINWFKKIDKKNLQTFTIFDIKDFYPSIKETLLKNAIQFASEHTDINKNDFEVTVHARKSSLFHSN